MLKHTLDEGWMKAEGVSDTCWDIIFENFVLAGHYACAYVLG